jgi:hypothetical protein
MGVNLYIRFFDDLKKIISCDKINLSKQTEIYILYLLFFYISIRHISLSSPNLLDENLKKNHYHYEITFEQKRAINPNNLRMFSEKLKDYLLQLKQDNQSEFNILDENNWEYNVWTKKILFNLNN